MASIFFPAKTTTEARGAAELQGILVTGVCVQVRPAIEADGARRYTGAAVA